MLVEIAIGDAYGAGFEFAKKERLAVLKNDLGQYYKHNLPGNLKAGMYTDDTQMSIAIVEMILSGKDWTVENLADKFIEVYKRDPRDGYSRKFQEVLNKVSTGDELRGIIVPNSDRCGAAMRAVPLGIFIDPKEIMYKAHVQASITHNTTDGIRSAQAIALASHWARTFPSQYNLNDFLNFYLETNIDWTGWPKGQYVSTAGIDVARAAISAFRRNNSYGNLLKECVDYTGDVDSVCAIAMGLASGVGSAYKNDLPVVLLDGLENNGFGYDYLVKLDEKIKDYCDGRAFNLRRS